LSATLAWRVPRLEFNATPIAEVVAMFNRHAAPQGAEPAARLTLADPALATLPLSGVLRADNITVLLQIMESSYGIQAERRPTGEIVLRKAR
jgi:transmembrane sensor